MPILTRDHAKIFYELHGLEGPPLLLCNGIGFSSWSWWRQIADLAAALRVIAFDNRGCGGSPWNGQPFSIEDLADDAAAVLDELKVEQAHVFGISMGGFIAQEFALRHPDRLLSLSLGCTHCGAPEAEFMAAEVIQRMTDLARLGWTVEGVTASLDLNFSPAFLAANPEFVHDYVDKRVANASSSEGWVAQRESSLRWRSFPRLGQIAVPTRILHGADDAVVPVQNANIIAGAIPGATVKLWPQGRHGFFMENASEVNAYLKEAITLGRQD
jgi:pimeloyl-ACP methyl ester carboxylesterase